MSLRFANRRAIIRIDGSSAPVAWREGSTFSNHADVLLFAETFIPCAGWTSNSGLVTAQGHGVGQYQHRHDGASVWAFTDGHARSYRGDEVFNTQKLYGMPIDPQLENPDFVGYGKWPFELR
jgi:prepilin-type processing-associated H-X9-DG protein